MLFADVVDSTRLSGTVDPEQVESKLVTFFQIAREEITRYGGTVERYLGDGVIAIFGLPMIHEDDAERAARAAVAIRRRVGPLANSGTLPWIRIGVDAGEVVVNPEGPEEGERLLTGMPMNLAVRLQQNAAPGQVLVGERVMRQIRHVAFLRPVRPFQAKGVDAPLAAWEILDVAPPQNRWARATAFVGRQDQLRLLSGEILRARDGPRGQVVTIIGSAGVGKTRLAQEFCAAHPAVRALHGRALPYGSGVTFSAFAEAVREESGILPRDPLDAARRKMEEGAVRAGVAQAIPALAAVLGLGAEERELPRTELFAGLQAFFAALARRRALFLILEDLHSADDVSLDFLEDAAGRLDGTPMLILTLARPLLLERRPSWMHGSPNATTLVLDPLDGVQSRTLAQAVLGNRPAPERLMDLVLARAAGNPLFLEEMLWSLRERSVLRDEGARWSLAVPLVQVALPDTVHAVIAARIDGLPDGERRVLQSAAVAGKEFWLGAVRSIAEGQDVDDAVRALVRKDVLVQKPQSTLAGEDEYSFRHILIRDVAYGLLTKGQRLPEHTRCAEWLEQIAGDRHAEHADLIAHHWSQVIALRRDLALAPDAEASRRAVVNSQLAADHAAGLYANATALEHYSRVLDLDAPAGARMEALRGRGKVRMLLGEYDAARDDFEGARTMAHDAGEPRWEAVALDELGHLSRRQEQVGRALEHLQAALALSRAVDDPALTGRILHHVGVSYFSSSRYQEAIAAQEEARRLFERCEDEVGLAECLHGLGECFFFLGNFQGAVERLGESAVLAERTGNRQLAGENRHLMAFIRILLGQYAEAQREAEQGVAALTEIGDAWNLSFALGFAGGVAAHFGQYDKALPYSRRGLELARQLKADRPAVVSLLSLGIVHRELEEWETASAFDHEAVELARSGEVRGQVMQFSLAFLAADCAALGRFDDGERYLEEARHVPGGSRSFMPEVLLSEGRLRLAMGRPAEARKAGEMLLAVCAAAGAMHWQAPAALLVADATAALHDAAGAEGHYRTAIAEAERFERVTQLWRAEAGLAEVQALLGRTADSQTSARRAVEIIDRLARSVPDDRLRAGFLRSDVVRRVAALAAR